MIRKKIGFLIAGHKILLNDTGIKKAREAINNLEKRNINLTVVEKPFVDTKCAIEAARKVRNNDLDTVIIFCASWADSPVLIAAIEQLNNVPVLVWGFGPFKNDKGILESTGSLVTFCCIKGPIKRMGLNAKAILGDVNDENTLRDIEIYANAAYTVRKLKLTRIGLVGSVAYSMYPGTFDHALLRKFIGPEVEYIDGYLLIEIAESFGSKECKPVIDKIRKIGKVNVSEERLIKSVKLYLSMKKIIKDYDLDAINVRCHFVLSKTWGCVACIPLSLLADEGIVSACEGDVLTTTTMIILNYLSNRAIYFGDIQDLSKDNNSFYLSSCGFTPFSLSCRGCDINIIESGLERFSGPISSTKLKLGEVTFARLNEEIGSYRLDNGCGTGIKNNLRWRFSALEIKLPCSIDKFIDSLESQHYAIAYGDYTKDLNEVVKLLGIDNLNF